MATLHLPAAVAAYFDARNIFDIDATIATFAEDAVVEDEHELYRGRPAIRAWLEETVRKYRPITEPQAVSEVDGLTVVSGLVSGDFPGSPVLLDYAFTLADGEIVRMTIDS